MVQWDRTDSRIWWARVGQWIPMDSPTILHGTVGEDGQWNMVGQRIPMDCTTCPMV